jgi:hypothetical protein
MVLALDCTGFPCPLAVCSVIQLSMCCKSRVIIILLIVLLTIGARVIEQNYDLYLPIILSEEIRPSFTPTTTSTATPTPTFTNTPTSTATPTPTRTNTPTPGQTWILPNDTYYVDSTGYIHFFGEVQNDTSYTLYDMKFIVDLFNSNNDLVAIGTRNWGYTFYLPPGEKTCFEVSVKEPADWSYYQIESPSYGPWPLASSTKITVVSHSGTYDPKSGNYDILGMVRNDNSVTYEYIKVSGSLYNNSEKVVGCGYSSTSNTTLFPGQMTSFDLAITATERDYSDVTSYRLLASGSPKE